MRLDGIYLAARGWRNDGRLHLLLLACAAVFAVSQMMSAGAAAAAVVWLFLQA